VRGCRRQSRALLTCGGGMRYVVCVRYAQPGGLDRATRVRRQQRRMAAVEFIVAGESDEQVARRSGYKDGRCRRASGPAGRPRSRGSRW
jgi:hypothetical protein